MPFKSKSQMRRFYAMEQRGELPKGTTQKWLKHTMNTKKLPERAIEKKAAQIVELVALLEKIAGRLTIARMPTKAFVPSLKSKTPAPPLPPKDVSVKAKIS